LSNELKEELQGAERTKVGLHRVLGRADLVLLFVVAIFNLNVVPSIVANGGVTVWLWLAVLVCFFWPQGIAVIELAERFPGEGGVYLWAKEVFGDFHGFLSGWCYWTNNLTYVPSVLLYFVGVFVFVLGAGHEKLAANKSFAVTACVLLLAFLVVLNVVGLKFGKWINNVGAIGTLIAGIVLLGLGAVVATHFGISMHFSDLRIPANLRSVLNSFGLICYALVGLELASTMGDEIKNPLAAVPTAVARGGILVGLLYLGSSLTLLMSVRREDLDILEGIVQAVRQMAHQLGIGWLVVPFALFLSLSIAGIASAWLAGPARIPFVAGLDSYMPSWLGNVHPRYGTPYAALIVHAVVSLILVLLNFGLPGATVQESFQRLLSLSVVLQLVPFLYMFGALLKIAFGKPFVRVRHGRTRLILVGVVGCLSTALGIALVFFPAQQITSLFSYEVWMFGGTVFFVGIAALLFIIYGRRKRAQGVPKTLAY
jgi:amino acid transporter